MSHFNVLQEAKAQFNITGPPKEILREALHKRDITDCGITGIDIEDEVVYYHVTCVISSISLKWTNRVRFKYFCDLYLGLDKIRSYWDSFEHLLPPFPKKRSKIFTNHLNKNFIQQRRVLLDNFLHKVVMSKNLRQSVPFLEFCKPGPHVMGETELSMYDPSAGDIFDNDAWGGGVSEYEIEDGEMEPYEVTEIKVPHTQILRKNHVIYQIDVINKLKEGNFSSWVVLKRFGDFCKLDQSLRRDLKDRPDLLAQLQPLPPKKLKVLTDHFDPVFIEERRILLEVYLRVLINTPQLRTHTFVLRFLGV